MQAKVKKFNEKRDCHSKPMPVHARLMDLQSELGELSKEYLKGTSYGTKDFATSEDFLMEYGDVLYCILSLANEVGIDAEQCLDMALNKYAKRIESKQKMDSGR